MRRRLAWHALIISCLLATGGCGGSSGGTVTGVSTRRSPIKHLIVVIGENRSFDNVFGTYIPPDSSETVWNLLSQQIVSGAGQPGSSFTLAAQQQASDTTNWELSPAQTGAFSTLPQPSTGFNGLPVGPCTLTKLLYPKTPLCSDIGLDPTSQSLLSAPGTGQGFYFPPFYTPVPDCRYPSNLPNGPYSLVGASQLNQCGTPVIATSITPTTYINNTGDPVHRFYQMWQQSDCSAATMTAANPSGCMHDLVTWVATTVGWGVTKPPTTDEGTYQGGVAMGYYNMAMGDYPTLLLLADNYAINDNYHQPVMGGTGPNSQFIYTGDVFYFTDSNGNPATPADALIENPNPQSGTNNFYTNDGFGSTDAGSTGVTFTNCSDNTQPGVSPIMNYLGALPYTPFNHGNCDPGKYYQVNNDYPNYNTAGAVISSADSNELPAGPSFSIGPQSIPTIGDALAKKHITWKYYGEGFNNAANPAPLNQLYCAICNAFQYSTSIMTGPLRANLVDLDSFYSDLSAGTLPAVSFVKPDTLLDSHPGTSTPALFEAFLRNLIAAVQAEPKIWGSTAILITYDESGGEYDSGYIQPIDFFGDGPRTVMIAVSPYAKPGYVDHTYGDHASILKFIEWNWRLRPLSSRSRDRLPNPTSSATAPYFPTNSPAIGDLTTMFDFTQARHAASIAGGP
ncbi:MAG: phosphoesterase [Candidatus Binataceae bacterium]|nr:phosphoesterase [Candidatus Binataceae bacterium]